jgi:hypothetical protein
LLSTGAHCGEDRHTSQCGKCCRRIRHATGCDAVRAIKRVLCLNAPAGDFMAAERARRSQKFDCAFKRIKHVALASHTYLERIAFISALIAAVQHWFGPRVEKSSGCAVPRKAKRIPDQHFRSGWDGLWQRLREASIGQSPEREERRTCRKKRLGHVPSYFYRGCCIPRGNGGR